MNRLKLTNVLTMVAIAAFSLISCVPEDGDDGPVGPIGPEGPPGADGVIGQDGKDGADGGSQVVSKTYTVTGDDFVLDPTTAFLTDTIAEPLLTKDIVDNGAIQVFVSESAAINGATWHAMTYSTLANIGGNLQYINFSYGYSEDNLYLRVNSSVATNFNFPSTASYFYKLVLIPDVLRKKNVNHDNLSLDQLEMLYDVKEIETIAGEDGLQVIK